jgi:hypothetical protein
VEFEFPMRDGAPQSAHINWPGPSATFVGVGEPPVVVLASEALRGGAAKAETEALPGKHASMDIYPPREYRVLNVPLDGLAGPVRIFGKVLTTQDGVTKIVAGFTEQFDQAQGLVARMNFTLERGDYVCDVLVWEQSTARLFGEMIKFQVK